MNIFRRILGRSTRRTGSRFNHYYSGVLPLRHGLPDRR